MTQFITSSAGELGRDRKLTKAQIILMALLIFNPIFLQAQSTAGMKPFEVRQPQTVTFNAYQTADSRQSATAGQNHLFATDNFPEWQV